MSRPGCGLHRGAGFTLIELMIVVACVAILATIVLPSFQSSIRKARRTDARAALTTVAQLLERYNTEKSTYAGATLGTGGTIPYQSTSENGYYTISLSNLTASTYTITATPTAGGGQAVDLCGAYTLDQAGTRGAAAATSQCW